MFYLHYSENKVIIAEMAEACMVVCLYKKSTPPVFLFSKFNV